MQFAAIVFLVIVERFQYLRRLAELVQFTRYEVLRCSRRPHPGIPANAVQPAWHVSRAQQSRFMPQTPRVAIAEPAFQSAVNKEVRT